MPDLRDMELLAALARHKHFARAAAECGISQPAFSARIRNLEEALGAPVVMRGNRFMGFTHEGEIAVKWARIMSADARGLRQEIDLARGALTGDLVVGAVPTALAFAGGIAAELQKSYESVAVQVYSRSAGEIAQGLQDFSLDVGITYQESSIPAASRAEQIYEERYELLVPAGLAGAHRGRISWAQAAEFPLCLLTRNMQNRKIVDEAFAAACVAPKPVMETNSFIVALLQAKNGNAATIAPEILSETFGASFDLVRLPLVEPEIVKPLCMVIADRDRVIPAVEAFQGIIRQRFATA
ncbi:MAG: LysR family transcriptional regulator [Pseudomonadota bacterium]